MFYWLNGSWLEIVVCSVGIKKNHKNHKILERGLDRWGGSLEKGGGLHQ